MRLPASVYLIALNEAENLRRLLPQLQEFAEIIVVDSGSVDDTVSIAGGFANTKVSYRSWTGFSDQKSHALALCTQPWVLNLDADEALTPELLAAMRTLITEDNADALQCERILLRWGKRPRNFSKKDILIRFFRRGAGHYEYAKVHERITITGRIKTTTATLLHFENLTFGQRMAKSNQYSQLKAEDKFAKGARCSIWHLLLVFPVSFLACYFGKGFFLDGGEGVLTSMNHAYYNFMKYAKLWEMQNH